MMDRCVALATIEIASSHASRSDLVGCIVNPMHCLEAKQTLRFKRPDVGE